MKKIPNNIRIGIVPREDQLSVPNVQEQVCDSQSSYIDFVKLHNAYYLTARSTTRSQGHIT
jgi:hypothetical protein